MRGCRGQSGERCAAQGGLYLRGRGASIHPGSPAPVRPARPSGGSGQGPPSPGRRKTSPKEKLKSKAAGGEPG